MTDASLWLIFGLVLCGLEMLHPGIFLLWVGLAACGTAAMTAVFSVSFTVQLAGFVTLAVVLAVLPAWRLYRRPGRDRVNAPEAGLIGLPCTALEFTAGHGRVTLRDSTWAAETVDGSAPRPGQRLTVVGLSGTTLRVSP